MKKAFFRLHIAVLLAGLTGVLGKLISLNEGLLVWYRLLLTVPSLWLSVGLVCFSSIGFFTALIEPLILRHRVDVVELMLGVLVIVGIFFIFKVDPHFKTGIAIGLVSAFLGSLFPVLNKRILRRVSSENVTLYELSGGFLVLTVLMPLYLWLFPAPSLLPGWSDLGWLLILAWACTVLAFNLSMSALQKISAFTVNLTYNLEPVYGILLAFALFREDKYLSTGFYVGFLLILLSIVLQMMRLKKKQLKIT